MCTVFGEGVSHPPSCMSGSFHVLGVISEVDRRPHVPSQMPSTAGAGQAEAGSQQPSSASPTHMTEGLVDEVSPLASQDTLVGNGVRSRAAGIKKCATICKIVLQSGTQASK